MIESTDPSIALLWRLSALLTVLTIGVTRLLLVAMLPQMERSAFVAVNFRGRTVPSAAGMIPVLVSGGALLFWLMTPTGAEGLLSGAATGLLFATFGFGLVGMLDDAIGDRTAGGLRGHWRRLVRGDVTTGGLKAMFGVVLAVAVAGVVSRSGVEWLLNAFIIGASANAINLFDVRPGRALKTFFVLIAVTLFAAPTNAAWIVIVPSAAAWLAFAPEDLRGAAMLGDGGANAGGALFGVAAAVTGTALLKVVLAIALAGLHIATERGSITAFIGRTPVLRRLDEWGRGNRSGK